MCDAYSCLHGTPPPSSIQGCELNPEKSLIPYNYKTVRQASSQLKPNVNSDVVSRLITVMVITIAVIMTIIAIIPIISLGSELIDPGRA